ncbi:MAG: threonine ammonia-lyase [Acidimicrobiia bacterium]
MPTLPTFADVEGAASRIKPHVHRTPVFTSSTLDLRAQATVFCKAENLQKVGAFKARGATNAVLSLSDAERTHGVATHSSGNHGQAVAYAAGIVGAQATVVMPDHAPAVKVDAVRGYGATVVMCPHAEREATLADVVATSGATVIHPFDDARVIAGQGTAALELLEDIPDLDVVVTPIGGGGLLSGSTLSATALGVETVGAEPELVDDAYRSLRDGQRYEATGAISVGDGLLTGIGALPFAVLTAAGTEVVTVSEEAILEAMRFVVSRTKYLIEPSAATAFAAVFGDRERFAGRRVGIIVTGGNVELGRLAG